MPECALGIVPDVGATDYLRSCLEGGGDAPRCAEMRRDAPRCAEMRRDAPRCAAGGRSLAQPPRRRRRVVHERRESCAAGGIGQWASLTGGRFSSDAMAAGGLCTHVYERRPLSGSAQLAASRLVSVLGMFAAPTKPSASPGSARSLRRATLPRRCRRRPAERPVEIGRDWPRLARAPVEELATNS